MSESLTDWMAWEGGVDVVAATDPSLKEPNVIIHLARMVHTPVGSAPSGIVFWQPDLLSPPAVVGFVSADEAVGRYFGPRIFAGTPFENAPVLVAEFDFEIGPESAIARVTMAGHVFETTLSGLGPLLKVERSPIPAAPFFQQGAEAVASVSELRVDGNVVPIFVPPVGISGGPAAVVTPFGSYAR
jgi:hypothetical protein